MYKIIVLLSLFCFFTSVQSYACCAERNYRLFPLGEFNQKVIFVEFAVHRKCNGLQHPITTDKARSGTGEKNEFWIEGVINLVRYENDSLILIENIDTIEFKECVCTFNNQYEKSNYESIIEKYYNKALNRVKDKEGFIMVKPIEITFNDDSNISQNETILTYKGSLEIDADLEFFWACETATVIEDRLYKTKNFEISILRISCGSIAEDAATHNSTRFKKMETAFWKEKATYHGYNCDYVYVKSKNK